MVDLAKVQEPPRHHVAVTDSGRWESVFCDEGRFCDDAVGQIDVGWKNSKMGGLFSKET